MNRSQIRHPIKSIFLGILLTALSVAFGSVSLAAPQGDGKIRLFNYHLDEFTEVTFRQNGKLIENGVKKINHIFRSRDNSEVIPIHIPLIDILDNLQDHFGIDTVEIISGYRRQALNEQLRNGGHSVSPVSFHIKGMAADIHIDEIREEVLRDYAVKLQVGGIGYYGSMDFVHVDLGPVRHWGEQDSFARKLVGVLKEEATIQLTSNKNDYLSGDRIRFRWTRPQDFDLATIEDLHLEHFFRGTWHRIDPAPLKAYQSQFELSFKNPLFRNDDQATRYGKYRWTFQLEDTSDLYSSNEFYLKKI
jgi:uncharacterized protein YcbK (DUF882 family)